MRRPVLLALLLMVSLPLVLLGWFGARVLVSEQAALQHRMQALVRAQLDAVDAEIGAYFDALARELAAEAARLPLDSARLREYLARAPRVRQLLLMGPQGGRLHPPDDAGLSADERDFLARTGRIWRDRTLLHQRVDPGEGDAGAVPVSAAGGWYVWYWQDETDLIYWRRIGGGRLLGFELEPARVLADLIARLPATDGPRDRLGEARVRLSDHRGTVVYQWGGYEPPAGQAALAVRPLSHPLGGWRLAYLAPPPAPLTGGRLFTVGVVAVCAVLVFALAWFLYREQTREARLARQRLNFVNQVSHELKTPLTNIRMYAELLQQRLEDDDGPVAHLKVIVDESQRLSRLIGNVLSFAGLQQRRLQARYRAARLDDAVAAALAACRPALAAKDIAVAFRPDGGGERLLDPDLVEQIVSNLLSNVEKYAGGGRVRLATRHRGRRVWIVVRDFGPGIPPRERERVFRPFYRVSSKLSDGVAGTGIGLSITRELARLHGGELRLLDSAGGACFEVELSAAETNRAETV